MSLTFHISGKNLFPNIHHSQQLPVTFTINQDFNGTVTHWIYVTLGGQDLVAEATSLIVAPRKGTYNTTWYFDSDDTWIGGVRNTKQQPKEKLNLGKFLVIVLSSLFHFGTNSKKWIFK